MSASPGPADQTFLAAEKVVAILARAGIDSALIGAAALALGIIELAPLAP